MALFTTRVELDDAKNSEDYERLYAEMAKDGFTRTIQLQGETAIYQLPTAEYNKSAEPTTAQVLELAKKAATRTSKKFSVLVTKADGRREWHNLTPVKK
jgi:hypothetical protein